MNRENFSKRSGVIVDRCLHHGTWFDPTEAQRAAEYVAAGGKQPRVELERRASPVSAKEALGAFSERWR